MVMQKHQGGLTAVCVQIDLQPRELGCVKVPLSLTWLMRVKRDKMITLVIEAVMVGRVQSWYRCLHDLVEGLAMIVVPQEHVGRTLQRTYELQEQVIRRFVLRLCQRAVTVEHVRADQIPANDGKGWAWLQSIDYLDDALQGSARIEVAYVPLAM